ncbi:hypothetical protein G6O69_32970 [Pseudenhygromyxa sp. WMMC2535]|uniref:hypothetical protein n=1 Tax=Pseudenhygromyxa sp. WMMC2535 TaxID=2712867 RepID=UPI001557CAC5|nr:hypothetical protein [Pseudenhygromyxa sp. WMMC2535]NVB42681.1 hypothetical protein [Pseudenhygromyxa sp. WMMC2535]
MTFWVYLVVAAIAALGLFQTMRGQARSRRYLESSAEEHPLQLSHLPRGLQALARDTRALRLSLEGPLRELAEGGGGAMFSEFDELQQRLRDAARELGDWVHEVERLSQTDAAYMRDVGAEPGRVRGLFEEEGWSLERKREAGQPALRVRLEAIVRELELFEERLQTPPDPYR